MYRWFRKAAFLRSLQRLVPGSHCQYERVPRRH
jgi:hypothetical protein